MSGIANMTFKGRHMPRSVRRPHAAFVRGIDVER